MVDPFAHISKQNNLILTDKPTNVVRNIREKNATTFNEICAVVRCVREMLKKKPHTIQFSM